MTSKQSRYLRRSAVIHGDQFSISIDSLHQSTTLVISETEVKPSHKRIALAGTDITDQDNFMDKLLNYRIENSSSVEDWRSQEQMGQEKQLEIIRTLQATVENQGKLLKAMADRLKISDIED